MRFLVFMLLLEAGWLREIMKGWYLPVRPDLRIGDFPLYLHDYPACLSSSHSVNLAVPLHWMLKRYALLLGDRLIGTL